MKPDASLQVIASEKMNEKEMIKYQENLSALHDVQSLDKGDLSSISLNFFDTSSELDYS